MFRRFRGSWLVAGGAIVVVSAAAWAQQDPQAQPPVPPARPTPSAGTSPTVVVDGQIEWIDRASLATKRPGVVQHVELSIGMPAERGVEIAFLDAELAKLERDRAMLNARNEAGILKAQAQRELAMNNMARAERIRRLAGRDGIADEEYQTKQAELKLAEATVQEEREKLKIAQKELELAEQAVREHIIASPFDCEILEVLKRPGEAVQANEPVVHVVRTDQVRFFGHVPLQVVSQLKTGMVVDVTPTVEGYDLPIEKKRFRGKLVFIGSELTSARNHAEVVVKADILNNIPKELRVGHKAVMTVYLDPAQIPPPPEDMLPELIRDAKPNLGFVAPPAGQAEPIPAQASNSR